jgi:hypothetical protein
MKLIAVISPDNYYSQFYHLSCEPGEIKESNGTDGGNEN